MKKKLGGTFQVQKEKCDQCLFTENRIVSVERMMEILDGCEEEDKHFICHKSSIKDGGNVCCRGFYDRDPNRTNLMRIAHRLGVVEEVHVE